MPFLRRESLEPESLLKIYQGSRSVEGLSYLFIVATLLSLSLFFFFFTLEPKHYIIHLYSKFTLKEDLHVYTNFSSHKIFRFEVGFCCFYCQRSSKA